MPCSKSCVAGQESGGTTQSQKTDKTRKSPLGALKAWGVCEVSEETCPRLTVTLWY